MTLTIRILWYSEPQCLMRVFQNAPELWCDFYIPFGLGDGGDMVVFTESNSDESRRLVRMNLPATVWLGKWCFVKPYHGAPPVQKDGNMHSRKCAPVQFSFSFNCGIQQWL